jgi:hypothetical protein
VSSLTKKKNNNNKTKKEEMMSGNTVESRCQVKVGNGSAAYGASNVIV